MVKSLIIFEYSIGGGFSKTQSNSSLAIEGYAMLYSVIEDLKKSGYKTITTLDERFVSHCKLPADEQIIIPIGEDPLEKLKDFFDVVDGAILVAPAFKEALYRVTYFMEKHGVNVLGSNSHSVLEASDKRLTMLILEEANLPTPKTKIVDVNEDVDSVRLKVEEIGYPVIFKPADGVGCSGVSLVKDYSKIPQALNLVRKNTKTNYFLIQEFLDGFHASVNILTNGEEVLVLSLNQQNIKIKPPPEGLSYQGNIVPIIHPQAEKVKKTVKKLVETMNGLKGYVGVDLILTRNEVFVVDVNPRITTSYLGLRKISKLKLGEQIVKAGLGLKIPKKFPLKKGVTIISKLNLQPNKKPPLPTKNIEIFYLPNQPKNFLVATVYGKNLFEAKKCMKNFRKNL